jgi:hypothetical protein
MNDQPRMRHQRAGDLQALQHAAGEGPRQVIDPVGVDLHLRKPVDGAAARMSP